VIHSLSAGDDRVEVSRQEWRLNMATRDTGGQKQTTRRDDEVDETQTAPSEDVQERQDKLTDDVDAILDEIDEVLEENAEEFVRSYVQKGGE
jgi:prokaryotic ubiquitin-like protein Pup